MQNITFCQLGNGGTNTKKVWLEKKFAPYPHFIMHEATLAPLNEHPTDDLTCLSRDIPLGLAIHNTM